MVASAVSEGLQTLCVEKELLIDAPLDIAFESLLEELGPENEMMDGTPMPMMLEAWPGGRWFRDLGKNSGHFWGVVQVIKPPKLLELSGPMFMSYPCANHIQFKLAAEAAGVKLSFLHRGFGEIPAEHREGVVAGWGHILDRIRTLAETKRKA